MKITPFENDKFILLEVGNRIKQYRISMNLTQQQLAQQCGLSIATLSRIENGDDTKWSAIIKVLSSLQLTGNLDVLIPEPQPDYKSIFEKTNTRKRVRLDKTSSKTPWLWNEDKGGTTK